MMIEYKLNPMNPEKQNLYSFPGEKADPEELQTLKTDRLVKSYFSKRVVNEVSIDIRQSEVVGLLGPNGAGKTTTFYMVVGLTQPDSGKVFINQDDITDQPMYIRARRGISYLPQEASIFRKLTVEENLLSILENLDLSHSEKFERLNALLQELGVAHLRKRTAYNLSGGERRRVEIARALVSQPKFILLDEPFTGIDPIAIIEIQKIISLLREKNIGILITDHNVRETLQITDRAYIINEGKTFRSGTPLELTGDSEVRKIYLGEHFRLH
jgi:lipopolysaccharide export system ATP-binding protein